MKTTNTSTIVIAGALGFIAGILFAPRSGDETREKLRLQAEEMKGRVRNATDELKRRTSEAAEQVKDVAEAAKQKGRTTKDVVHKHAQEAEAELQTKV